jgi:DNA-binding response OmpR family regulator
MMTNNDMNMEFQPRLVLAHTDITYAALASRHLRRQGWDVYLAKTGDETRRLARNLAPAVVVLETDLPDESGWLVCDKLARELPGIKAVLVGKRLTQAHARFAAFVGAAGLVRQRDGVAALKEVLGTAHVAAV